MVASVAKVRKSLRQRNMVVAGDPVVDAGAGDNSIACTEVPHQRLVPWHLRMPTASLTSHLRAEIAITLALIRMLIVNPNSQTDSESQLPLARARHDGRPRVSLVAVLRDDDGSAATMLMTERGLRHERADLEIVLVCAGPRSAGPISGSLGARMRLIRAPADAAESQLRALGLAAATGDIVMMLDDPASDHAWIDHVCEIGGNRSRPSADRSAAGGLALEQGLDK